MKQFILRDRKIKNFSLIERKNGSDLEDRSAGDIHLISPRNDLREMNRFFPSRRVKVIVLRSLTLLLCALLACSCSGKKNGTSYEIGIDPAWYPLQLAGQGKNILAFSIELLVEIAKKEHLQLAITNANSDNLLSNLNTKKYDAILTSMTPYNFYLKGYSFSELYLMTGPVLVVRSTSTIESTKDLKGKEVGVVKGSSGALLLQSAPGVIVRNYDSIPEALVDLSDQQIEAALVEVLIAQDYVRNFYNGTLKIATSPLNEDGLRVVTLHNKDSLLLKRFNHGLAQLKKSGQYDKLLKKWGLSSDGKPVANLDQEIEAFLQKVF